MSLSHFVIQPNLCICNRSSICYRDTTIHFSPNDRLISRNILELYSPEALTRTELSSLIGLMLKNAISLDNIDLKSIEHMITQTDELLKEIHESIIVKFAKEDILYQLKQGKKR